MMLLHVMQNEEIIPNLQQQPGLKKHCLEVKITKEGVNAEQRELKLIKT